MADSENVSLSYSGTTITISGPKDSTEESRPRYAADESAGGTPWSYKLAATIINEWTLNFDYLSAADKSALANFFNNVVEGPTNAFTYVHTNGQSKTVRFKDRALKFRRRNAADWSTSFTLVLVNQTIS